MQASRILTLLGLNAYHQILWRKQFFRGFLMWVKSIDAIFRDDYATTMRYDDYVF